jgi:hypothetical protein
MPPGTELEDVPFDDVIAEWVNAEWVNAEIGEPAAVQPSSRLVLRFIAQPVPTATGFTSSPVRVLFVRVSPAPRKGMELHQHSPPAAA